MKKFLILFLLLASCQLEVDKEEIPEFDSESVSWNSMTFKLPLTWEFTATAESLKLNVSETENAIELTWDAELPEGEFEKIQIADQNYKLISSDPLQLSTSWSTHDVLISSNMSIDDVYLVLNDLSKSRLEWMGYEFDRPVGADWFMEEKTLYFMEDDGDFLENSAELPCTSCDYIPLMSVMLTDDSTKLNEINKNPDFYDEVNFNGVIYEVVRFTSMFDGKIYVTYKSKVGDEYLQINTTEDYEEDAEDILNEIIGL
jgi:hypothetical protein